MPESFFCFHGHFYQPPRGNPLEINGVLEEPEAAPYRNWNERITAECYAPLAQMGAFNNMSFNVGATLLRWLGANAPDTYRQIIAADQNHLAAHGVGNALAQPAHHTILPLASDRDKVTQVKWGLASFQHRFGHPAQGLWLPEMAVDLETLQVLAGHGVKFTILSQAQVKEGHALPGAGPYRVNLPRGGEMAVYVRHDALSVQAAFGVHTLGGAGLWSRETLLPHLKRGQRLTLIAVDGETFGHHFPGEEHFLHWLLQFEARAVGFTITTLARDLRDHPPQQTIEIGENSAWSCAHQLARWYEGCACTPGDSRWKIGLRRALDWMAGDLDRLYFDTARSAGIDSLALRDDYIRVALEQITPEGLLAAHGLSALASARALLDLLRAQLHRQRMYVSCAFFFEDLDRPEPRYAIANALAAARLACQATGEDLLPELRRKLALAISGKSGLTGADLLAEATLLLDS